jgi:putative RNA 2'-phosphotransferase
MTHPALIERITRSLAYMLRHQPEEFGLTLDPHGFGELTDVVRALCERLEEPVAASDVEEAIRAGDRPRYEIKGTRIRALYGHSIEVEPGEPSKPPEFLYVGIPARDAARAQRFGLSGGRRRFLHLALTQDDAREAGRRAAREYTVLRVFALDAWEEGVDFFDRKSLFLARTVPTEFLEVIESGRDGYELRRNGRETGERPRSDAQARSENAFPVAEPQPAREETPRPPNVERAPRRDRDPGRRDRDDRGPDRSRGGQRRAHDEPRHSHGGRRGRGPEHRGGHGDRRGGERREPAGRPEGPAYAQPAARAPMPTEAARAPVPTQPGGRFEFGVGIFDEPAAPAAVPVARPTSPPPAPKSAPQPLSPPPEPQTDFGAGV